VTGFVTGTDGRILLVKVDRRGWQMPGGQVEEGEDLVTALRREIAEESSCRIEVGDLVGLYSRISAPALLVALFRCTHTGGDPRPQDDDRLEAGWSSFEEARRLVTQPVTAGRIADALARPLRRRPPHVPIASVRGSRGAGRLARHSGAATQPARTRAARR
jgi:8-oxo-dGTP diphosphatase